MTKAERFDVAIVGAGIIGLAHAWQAARRGLRVIVLERDRVAQGATVRNFGMVWPIGQPADLYPVALRSRELWLEFAAEAEFPVETCGSILLAHRADELELLTEFTEMGSHRATILSPEEVLRRTPLANPHQLLGGVASETELRVDPRQVPGALTKWLSHRYDVQFSFQTSVVQVGDGQVTAADGRAWQIDKTIICSNTDFQTLFPESLASSGMRICKLQMLRTVVQPNFVANSPHIASGLTLRHYASFGPCKSLAALRDRVHRESPELDRYGIHVMATFGANGSVIVGDSHEYDDDITPFDKTEIDELILRELRSVIALPDWSISERWHGHYATHAEIPVFDPEVQEGVHLFVGAGGAGMTLAFGLAEEAWKRWS